MEKTVVMIIILICITTAIAQDWHVDKNDPSCSDTGPGNLATPFCTIFAANNAHIGGDTVYIHPGEYHERIIPQQGTLGAHTTFSGYGTREQVIITGATEVTGWTQCSGSDPNCAGLPNPTSVYYASFNAGYQCRNIGAGDTYIQATNCWEDRSLWYMRALQPDDDHNFPGGGGPQHMDSPGDFRYDSGLGLVFVWPYDNNHANSHKIECSDLSPTDFNYEYGDFPHKLKYFTLQNVTVMMTGGHGFSMDEWATNIDILNNEFVFTMGSGETFNGYCGQNPSAIYHGGATYAYTKGWINIIGNKIHQVGSHEGWRDDWGGDHRGSAIKLYIVTESVIANNEIYDATYAIEPKASVSRLRIENNTIHDISSNAIRTAYGLVDSTIRNNTFYNIGGNGFHSEGGHRNVSIDHNVFWNLGGNAIFLWTDVGRTVPTQTVTNNVEDLKIRNNIIKAGQVLEKRDSGTGRTIAISDMDNNLFASSMSVTYSDYGTDRNLANWQSTYGFDLNSFQADPQLVNPTIFDFRLQPTSPAIDAGKIIIDYHCSNPGDQAGCRVWFGGLPDIGVYENATGGPPPPPPQSFSCADLGGNICTVNETCNGTYISANDTNRCCSGNCYMPPTPQPTCSQLGGTICQTGYTCSGHILNASDSYNCCDSTCTALPPTGTIITTDSTYSGYTNAVLDDNVIDATGGTSTTWASLDNPPAPHWVSIDFGTNITFANATIWWAHNPNSNTFMTSQQVYVQYWDGSTWQTAAAIVESTPLASSTLVFSPVNTQIIRFYQPTSMGPPSYANVMWLTEIDYGTEGQEEEVCSLPFDDPICGCIDTLDAAETIQGWYTDSITLTQLIENLKLWKTGC